MKVTSCGTKLWFSQTLKTRFFFLSFFLKISYYTRNIVAYLPLFLHFLRWSSIFAGLGKIGRYVLLDVFDVLGKIIWYIIPLAGRWRLLTGELMGSCLELIGSCFLATVTFLSGFDVKALVVLEARKWAWK